MKFVHEKKVSSKFVHQVVPINEKSERMKFVHEKKTERGKEMLNQVEPDRERMHFVKRKATSMFVHQIAPDAEEWEEKGAEEVRELRESLEEKLKELSEAKPDEKAEIEADKKVEKALTPREKELVDKYSLYDIMYKDKQLYKKLIDNSVVLYKITFPDLSERAQYNNITLEIRYVLGHYFITWSESHPWCDYDWFYTDVGDDFQLALQEIKQLIRGNYEEAIKRLQER